MKRLSRCRRLRHVMPLLLFATFGVSPAEATRYHKYTEQFGNPEHGAEVVAATFFGSAGHEWLVAGDFAPDGTIVLAGNIVGPEFAIPGTPTAVIGSDAAVPPNVERVPSLDSKGRPRMNKDGSPRYDDPSWRHDQVTGFVLRCSPDLKQVLSVHRMPWGSGAITACVVGTEGAIYLAGKATDEITRMDGAATELPATDNGMTTGGCSHTFVAKLTAAADKVVWLRHMKGFSNAPKLAWTKQGTLQLTAQDIRKFSPDGKLLSTVIVPGGLGHLVGVNPVDGTYARGGEHHSPTGREPWRCPTLNIYRPDGSKLYHLYDWLGPYVGLDNLRLVSDTAVRRVTYDPDGNLLVYLWSDGGNSVALRDPIDVRRLSPKINGLGFSAWGAGVLSCAYLVKIDPQTYRALGGTMWLAYLESAEKPNSAWIHNVSYAPDGSVCFAGKAASSVIQTANRLSPCQYGDHVVILNDNLSAIRFSSTIPGCGVTQTGDDRENWGIASAKVGDKQRVLYVCGSQGGLDEFTTPTVNARQDKFGGGWSDGYALLLELDVIPRSSATEQSEQEEDWEFAGAVEVPSFLDKKDRGPRAGQTFAFNRETPKWITIDAEARAVGSDLWPSFLYGRPIYGGFTFDPKGPKGAFAWSCERICQRFGDQSRRVLGEIVPADSETPVDFAFAVKSFGPFQAREETCVEKGKTKKRTVVFAEADAELKIDGRRVPIKPECRFQFKLPRDGSMADRVQVDAHFTTTGKALGLKNPKAQGEISIRISGVGYAGSK